MNDRSVPENLGWWSALVLALGVPVKVQAILVRVGWVVAVTCCLVWYGNGFAWAGLPSPFAKHDDVAAIRHTQEVTGQIIIGGELAKAIYARCHEKDPTQRSLLTNYIDGLQAEYRSITHQDYSERC